MIHEKGVRKKRASLLGVLGDTGPDAEYPVGSPPAYGLLQWRNWTVRSERESSKPGTGVQAGAAGAGWAGMTLLTRGGEADYHHVRLE